MINYYRTLVFAALVMASLGLASCDSKSQDEPKVDPQPESTIPFELPGNLENNQSGYVDPFIKIHVMYNNTDWDPDFYFSEDEALNLNNKWKNDPPLNNFYVPSPDELVMYFPRDKNVDGKRVYYAKLNGDPQAPTEYHPNIVETVQFGRNASPIQAKSTFYYQPWQSYQKPSVSYAIRFQDSKEHRVFQRWTTQRVSQFGFPRRRYPYVGDMMEIGIISFLPYEVSATLGGKNAPVFTDEYWERRASDVKSVGFLEWGSEPETFGIGAASQYFSSKRGVVARFVSDEGFYLTDDYVSGSGVVIPFTERKVNLQRYKS